MFCESCGKQLPDNSAFCDGCGAQLNAAAPVAPAKPAMTPKQKKMLGMIGGGLAVVILVVVIIISIVGKNVDLKDYITITAEGYDGYASLDYEIDYYALFEKATGEDISGYESVDDLESLSNASSIMAKAQALEGGLNVDVTYPDGKEADRLANGDVVTFLISFDEEEADSFDVNFKEATVEYVVEGLAQAEVYDVISHFDLTFSGCDGEGRATLVSTESSETVGGIQFNVHEDENRVYYYKTDADESGYCYAEITDALSNGDTVTVTFSVESDRFAEYGVILEGLSKEYVVSGLGKYASTISEISADAVDTFSSLHMEKLKNRLYDDWGSVVHGSYWGTYKEQSIGDDLALYKTVLTTPKNTDSVGNTLWLIYSVTLDDNEIEKPTVYYFYYAVSNVVINADGTVNTEAEYDVYESSAYTDYDALYDDEINSYNSNVEVMQ